MAQKLRDWIEHEQSVVAKKTVKELSQFYFHRVETRPKPINSAKFFTPADGVVTVSYERLDARSSVIDVKGVKLSLRDILQEPELKGKFLIVGVFMTFYSQHQNFIPYPGIRIYYELPSLTTLNIPMLKVEKDLLKGVVNPEFQEEFMRQNSREISIITAPKIGQEYYIVRIGDYDVDTMVNWTQSTGQAKIYQQNDRFGMITYGSMCLLIIRQMIGGVKFKLRSEAEIGMYVKCCYDPLIDIEF